VTWGHVAEVTECRYACEVGLISRVSRRWFNGWPLPLTRAYFLLSPTLTGLSGFFARWTRGSRPKVSEQFTTPSHAPPFIVAASPFKNVTLASSSKQVVWKSSVYTERTRQDDHQNPHTWKPVLSLTISTPCISCHLQRQWRTDLVGSPVPDVTSVVQEG
jgi:hypothetical protein